MLTAAGLAAALTPALIEVAYDGEPRPVTHLEFLEEDGGVGVEHGDLVLAVGVGAPDRLLALLAAAGAASGLVARRRITDDAQVVAICRGHGLPLLTLADGVSWSAAAALLRTSIDHAERPAIPGAEPGGYGELFSIADKIRAILDAPVTIEDARSRVLAYSGGQDHADTARLSTIVGRRVPAAVRDHFRSTGVFRRLARSDEPFFVPPGPPDVGPRFVVPVRAGSEWLGSVWAVTDRPVTGRPLRELRLAAEVLALHLLRLRAEADLGRQLHAEQLRAVLRGTTATPPTTLGRAPWRVVALGGPGEAPEPESRLALWVTLARRHGWREPLITDLDAQLVTVVADDPAQADRRAGSWEWLRSLVTTESARDPTLLATAGHRVSTIAGLSASHGAAGEQLALGDQLPAPATTAEDLWAPLTVRRAVAGLAADAGAGPVGALASYDHEHRTALLPTLAAVLDHWGEPRRAARALGIHPNSVRNRIARIRALVELDLDDPQQRLAARLRIAALTSPAPPAP